MINNQVTQPRIVIIDPDENSAAQTAVEIKKAGFLPYLSPSGKEGLISAYRESPMAIIIDPVITDIDFRDLFARLKRDPRTTHTQLIAFSSLKTPEKIKWAIDLRFDHYIPKEGDAYISLLQAVEASVKAYATLASRKRGRFMEQAPSEDRSGKLIVIFSAKGGVGTSSICANLAHVSQESFTENVNVVVVDLVLPIGSIADIVGYEDDLDIVDVSRMSGTEANLEYLRQALPDIETWGFQLLAGSTNPDHAYEMDINRLPVILDSLTKIFDFVFVDLGKAISRISLPIILSADQLVFVLSLDLAAVHQTVNILNFLRSKGLKRHQVFPIINRTVELEGVSKRDVDKMIQIEITSSIPFMKGNFALANKLKQPITVKFPEHVASYAFRETMRDIKARVTNQEREFLTW